MNWMLMTFSIIRKKAYHINTDFQISHLLYMDNLKIYIQEKLRILLTTNFSNDIGITYGMEKYGAMIRGEWVIKKDFE